MEDPMVKAQYYRDQGVNMRTLAANEDNLEVRKALISVAETYDRLQAKFLRRRGTTADENLPRFRP